MTVETTLLHETERASTYRAVLTDASSAKPLSLDFTVSKSGALRFDNRQPGAECCLDPARSRLLAAEMLETARKKVPGALSGRTEAGLAFELRLHHRFWRRHILRSRTAVSDMGGLTRTAPDYDNNAILFERAARRGSTQP